MPGFAVQRWERGFASVLALRFVLVEVDQRASVSVLELAERSLVRLLRLVPHAPCCWLIMMHLIRVPMATLYRWRWWRVF